MIKLLQKYSTFLKYIFSAGTSFLIDLILFKLFSVLFKSSIGDYAIIIGTVLARILSSFYNYLMNRNAVFQSDKKGMDTKTFVKYYILVVIQMLVSSGLVVIGYRLLKIEELFVKIPVDILLFMVNYFVQKKFIFSQE